VEATPQFLQIEWTAKSETPITIFRVQFMAVDERDWREVDVTSSQSSRQRAVWYGQARLQKLKPNTQYMVQVSSLNNEGYSKFSSVTFFSTPRKESYQSEARSTSTNFSTRSSFNLFISLLSLALLVTS